MMNNAKTNIDNKGHGFAYQRNDLKWEVYVNVFPDLPEPLKYANKINDVLDLFDDAINLLKQHGYKKNKVIVQFQKRQ